MRTNTYRSKVIWLIFLCLIFIISSGNKLHAQQIIKHFNNGKIKEKGQMLDSLKSGVWAYFFESGRIERKEKWRKGKMKWAVYFNPEGRKTKIIDAKGKEKLLKGCNCKN